MPLRGVNFARRSGVNIESRLTLIQAVGARPHSSYVFRHALLQDAAYESILKSRRQELHGRLAKLLEDNYPQTVATEPEVVARHHSAASNTQSAVRYWLSAARRALQGGANQEAIGHLGRGLDGLMTLPDTTERQRQELIFQTLLGPALLATKGWAASEPYAVFERARELCRTLGDTRQMFAALWGIWMFNASRGKIDAARELVDELFRLAKEVDDPELLLQAHHAAWGTNCWYGEFEATLDHVEQQLAIYDRDKHRGHAMHYSGHDPAVCGKVQAALACWYLGYPDRALRRVDDGLALARELAHPPSIAHALLWVCMVRYYRGETAETARLAESLIALANEQVSEISLAHGVAFRGCSRVSRGQRNEGIAEIREGLEHYRATGARTSVGFFLTLLGQELLNNGRLEEAESEMSEALALIKHAGAGWWEPEIHRLRGEILLASPTPDTDAVDAHLSRGIRVARTRRNQSFELRSTTTLARFRRDQGRSAEARQLLKPVYDRFAEGFDTRDLAMAKALLADLE